VHLFAGCTPARATARRTGPRTGTGTPFRGSAASVQAMAPLQSPTTPPVACNVPSPSPQKRASPPAAAAPPPPPAPPVAQAAAPTPAPLLAPSPAASGASSGSISNNPLYARTPGHPTPPSVSTLRPLGAASAGAARRAPPTGGSDPASEGRRLAERLHAAAERLQTPATGARPAALQLPATPAPAAAGAAADAQEHTFQFKDDVAALLTALEARTPTPAADITPAPAPAAATAREAARASTEERPGARPRRRSSLGASAAAAPLLDLAGFDANGNRRTPEMATPTVPAPRGDAHRASPARRPAAAAPAPAPAAAAAQVAALQREAAALRQRCAALTAEREEAAGLLAGYQGSISELQDSHSAVVVRLQAEAALMKSEVGGS
jgi:hypothetical protein